MRIERADCFAGVYSLNDLLAGSGLGGFWVTTRKPPPLMVNKSLFSTCSPSGKLTKSFCDR